MKESRIMKKHAVIIGAGPAGLTAGVELLKTENFAVTVLERDHVVGGLAKTTTYKGCKYDIGPHHFITDSPKIQQWWEDLMQGDFIKHKRYTRIFYKKHFFNYPLEPLNVITGLNPFECLRSILSYLWYRVFPITEIRSFQDWVTNKFGYRLFSIFFKTYTEKVWGIACNTISADWAAQRIKGFSLSKAIFYAFFGRWFKKNAPRTISDTFYYPSKGAGTLWEKVAQKVVAHESGSLQLDQDVVRVEHDHKKILRIATVKRSLAREGGSQKLHYHEADYFFSTMPLRSLILAMDPLPHPDIAHAAKALMYRGLITVNLVVKKAQVCPDHWLYIHEKEVRMGRIGNMNNFSIKMVDDPSLTALSLEYFAFVDEPFWFKSDYELIEIGKSELEKIGLVKSTAITDGMVMRTAEAYPVYNERYKEYLSKVLDYLAKFENLQLMGRNGMHRYNNMDVAALSAMAAVEKVIDQEQKMPLRHDKPVESTFML
jgi:protoporphyrinogen oxidase